MESSHRAPQVYLQHPRLLAQVDVDLRQQSRNVGSVPAIAIIHIEGVEGDRASQRSSETLQFSHLLCRKFTKGRGRGNCVAGSVAPDFVVNPIRLG